MCIFLISGSDATSGPRLNSINFLLIMITLSANWTRLHAAQLTPTGWTNGQSSENQPRLLNSNVILVSRIYGCPNQHRVLAHHPDILKCFTTSRVWFLLLSLTM